MEETPDNNNNKNNEQKKNNNTTKDQWLNLNWKKVNLSKLNDKKTKNKSNKRKILNKESDDINDYTYNDEEKYQDDGNIGICYGLEVISGDCFQMNSGSTNITTTAASNAVDDSNDIVAVPKKDCSAKDKTTTTGNNTSDNNKEETKTKPKKKKKKKKKKAQQPTEEVETVVETVVEAASQEEETDSSNIEEISQAWSKSCEGVNLHPTLLKGLSKLNYNIPTLIQSKTLPPSIYGRRNIIGAAPTGSGKTLAFGLPILHFLLSAQEKEEGIKALCIAPSRELALQISKELNSVCGDNSGVKIVTIVGGLSQEKQIKKLNDDLCQIIVCTPGRLWELISSGDNEKLNKLSKTLQYLVIDEVDRMMMGNAKTSYPQLQSILEFINGKQRPGSHANMEDDDDDDDDDDDEMNTDEKEEKEDVSITNDVNNDGDTNTTTKTSLLPKRQTFIFSATLAMNYKHNPASIRHKKPKHNEEEEDDSFLSRIVERAGIVGPIKSIDLTSFSPTSSSSKSSSHCLPDSISLYELKCVQKHKDSYTYAILSTSSNNGPTIIFCNSILGVKRVTATLSLLCGKQNIHALYGNMPQKSRLQALESLTKSYTCNDAVLVSTDVASRGIDIPSVCTIIHYDIAHTVDTFIHRAGRTARGITSPQQSQKYTSISIVSPGKEEERHEKILNIISTTKFQTMQFNGVVLKEVQTRTSLASQIYLIQNSQAKLVQENHWMQRLSKEADIDLDDEAEKEYQEFNAASSGKDQNKKQPSKKQLQRMKMELNLMLQRPIQKEQRYGKFTFGLQNSIRLGLL